MKNSTKSILACAALAGLYTGSATAQAAVSHFGAGKQIMKVTDGDKHDCKGMNDCKGKGGCKTANNDCKGMNDCKGKGGCSTAPKPTAAPSNG